MPSVEVVLGCLLLAGLCSWRGLGLVTGVLLAICYFSVYMNAMFALNNSTQLRVMTPTVDKYSPITHRLSVVEDVEIKRVSVLSNGTLKLDATLERAGWLPAQSLRLYWRDAPAAVRAGQHWRVNVKLTPLTSVQNQGGFNRQRHWLSQHIIAKGNVQSGQRLGDANSIRDAILARLKPAIAVQSHHGLLAALMLGQQQDISASQWQQLRHTGMAHLVAISGLHLGVVAFWSAWLLLALGKRCYANEQGWPQRVALVLAMLVTLAYAWLSGMGLPAQRALVMLVIFVILSLLQRYSSPWERWLYALFVVLLIDPLASLSAGLWLSFVAVAAILMTVAQLPAIKPNVSRSQRLIAMVQGFWAVQWRLTLVLSGLQLFLFDGISVSSIVMNALMVPWFSLVVIPLGLLALVSLLVQWPLTSPWLGLLELTNVSLQPFVGLLQTSDLYSGWWPVPLAWQLPLLLAMLALLLAYLGRGFWRAATVVLLLPILALVPSSSPLWRVEVLDVGQGTAVAIVNHPRVMIYDSGAAFGDFSYAETEIIPWLQAQGLSLELLVISHKDNDHAGGAKALMKAYPQAQLVTNLAWPQAQPCHQASGRWHGVSLEYLWPPQAMTGNNGSCVLRLSIGKVRVLLSGDIEAQAEQSLVAAYGQDALRADVLVVPHHGSLTSSSADFIAAVEPKWVVYTAGFNNVYGFPKPEVFARYQAIGSAQYISGEQGQLSISLDDNQIAVRGFRQHSSPFWYNAVFGFGDSQDVQ
nr:DNA internalization-related competence protein ComEC/Rec2 [Shewanella sp. NIFS-20-20]